jgi:hypothetical protein
VNPLWILIAANILILGGIFTWAQSSDAASEDKTIVLNSRQFSSATAGTPQVAGETISEQSTSIDKCKASISQGVPKLDCGQESSVLSDNTKDSSGANPESPSEISTSPASWSFFDKWASLIGW